MCSHKRDPTVGGSLTLPICCAKISINVTSAGKNKPS